MFMFGKKYIKYKFKKTMNFIFKLAVTLFTMLSIGSMWIFFN